MKPWKIIIAGGGIGGMTAALALACLAMAAASGSRTYLGLGVDGFGTVIRRPTSTSTAPICTPC